MVEKDLEREHELGQATIVYESPDEDIVSKTVPNEHIAYFQDHWLVKTEEDEEGNDIVRRIPSERVYYVERSVEEFEDEVKTIRNQVQSVADNIRSKLPVGDDGDEGDTHAIEVEIEESSDDSRSDSP